MSVYITELLTVAVYCYFLLSLYKDGEAIQTPELLIKKRVTYLIHVIHTMLRSTTNHNFFLPSQVLYLLHHI